VCLPGVVRASVSALRALIFFLTDAGPPTLRHSGVDVSFGDLVAVSPGSMHHHSTEAACRWASLSLTEDDLAFAGFALIGRALTAPSVTSLLRPTLPLLSRLLNLLETAGQFAETPGDMPGHPEPLRALEQAMLHALIMCLTDRAPAETNFSTYRHLAIVARFEEFLAINQGRPLYLAEICAATNVPERTLRVCCQEHLGMGPVRYLWLRRMHQARRALVMATPEAETVTNIAMDHGFWELGRFAVKYKALFGERPSTSLHRPQDERRASRDRPLSFC